MDALVSQIKHNLDIVEQNIQKAAVAAGRQRDEVRLVTVSKSQSIETIEAAYTAGVRYFGENYPQEAATKISQLSHLDGIEWHMIGHLQSRKAPIIAKNFQMIHSIDSLSLAHKLDRILREQGKVMPALIEINIGGEESKFGWQAGNETDWESLVNEFGQIVTLQHLKIQGLMTMPPIFEDPELSRPFFAKLRRLRDFLAGHFSNIRWTELSMGTSADYIIAVEEGATMIRVGQAILGPRMGRYNEIQGEQQ